MNYNLKKKIQLGQPLNDFFKDNFINKKGIEQSKQAKKANHQTKKGQPPKIT